MNLFILLCIFSTTFAIGEYGYTQQNYEPDRARSAWNFGGKNANRGAVWLARTKNTRVPGSIVADRRGGYIPYKAPPPSPMQEPVKYLKYVLTPKQTYRQKQIAQSQKNLSQQKFHKHGKKTRPGKIIPAKVPKIPGVVHDYLKPRRPSRKQSKNNPWIRTARHINPRDDSVMEKFKIEELWHLDKGESYVLDSNDINYDHHRRKNHQQNEIHQEHHDEKENAHHHTLEEGAEAMVNHHEEKDCKHFHTGQDHIPQHVHHHHHYADIKKNIPKDAAKKPNINNFIPATIPRIHNPIPLGCLLAVPVFHPIRPRHHLTCLISIPGTPNLIRRRRRSVDLQEQEPIQPRVGMMQQQSEIYSRFIDQSNKADRKRYPGHVGGGKTPLLPPSQVGRGNFKLPATVIAPPKFEQSDVLSMLLGSSGGVTPTTLGKVLMSNNRYVRIGRGLPNSERTGRSSWRFAIPAGSALGQQFLQTPINAVPPPVANQVTNKRILPVVFKPVSSPLLASNRFRGALAPVSSTPLRVTGIGANTLTNSNSASSQFFVNPQSYTNTPVFNSYSSDQQPSVSPTYVVKDYDVDEKLDTSSGASNVNPEWKPLSKPTSTIDLNVQSKIVFGNSESLLATESQQRSSKIKPSPAYYPEPKMVKKNSIDVTDLVEALGNNDASPVVEIIPLPENDYDSQENSKTTETRKFEDDSIWTDLISESSGKPKTGSKSYSYAIKNEFIENSGKALKQRTLKASTSASKKTDDDLVGESSRTKLSKSKYYKSKSRKHIPDPIFVILPKDKEV